MSAALLTREAEELKAQRDELLALLVECLDREYNPFEPDNQSRHYKRLSEAVAKFGAMRHEA